MTCVGRSSCARGIVLIVAYVLAAGAFFVVGDRTIDAAEKTADDDEDRARRARGGARLTGSKRRPVRGGRDLRVGRSDEEPASVRVLDLIEYPADPARYFLNVDVNGTVT